MLKTKKRMSIYLNDNLVELLRLIVELHFKKGELLRDAIDRLSIDKKHKNSFVFGILSDEEFSKMDDRNDFGRVGKELYVSEAEQVQYSLQQQFKVCAEASRHTN
jgi:hypothetical protein